MRRWSTVLLAVVSCGIIIPATAHAQAAIAGLVKDTSGAVLPGVTVEASSPALIEKVRSVVSDGTGQYSIVDLRPGTYTVTFTLPGFNTFRREGIELTGSFTATVNADMRVGAVEETITVTGATSIVDIQSAARQQVMGHNVIDAIPTGRLPTQLAILIPGVSAVMAGGFNGMGTQDVGGAGGDQSVRLFVHGGKETDFRVTQNGLMVASVFRPDYDMSYTPNLGATQEVAVDTSGVSAEASEGGVRINLIPKEGGNTFQSSLFMSYANDAMAWSNFTDDLRGRGFATPNTIKRNGDINPAFGGPIKRDKLWFFGSFRRQVADNYVSQFFDRAWNTPGSFTVDLDANHRVSNDAYWNGGEARLTWQATEKNKFSVAYTKAHQCKCPELISATASPGVDGKWGWPHYFTTGQWSSPLTNRILLEGGVFQAYTRWGWTPLEGSNPDKIGWTEQSTNSAYKTYVALHADHWVHDFRYRAAFSYIAGAHTLKIGFSDAWGDAKTLMYRAGNHQLSYRLNNGVPNQITLWATPFTDSWEMDAERALYAQERWTIRRLTLTGGVRYEFLKTHFPGQVLGPVQFVPDRNIVIPDTPGLAWKDVTPRMGAVYDLLGTGKTALKITLNKYLTGDRGGGALGATIADPVTNLVTTTTRNWTDADRDFVPDCDLTNPLANGECQTMANANFGKNVISRRWDPSTLAGWGARPYNWEFSAGVQHEILPRVSADVSYFRRWYGNFTTTDDRALQPADFDSFSIRAPEDSRLPNGGNYVIDGLYNLKPAKFGVPADNFVTLASNYGKQIEHWNGVDVNINARLRDGLLVQGGLSTGRTSTDNCEIVAKLPELIATAVSATPQSHCHIDTPFLTQVKGLASYTVPRIDVQVSGAVQSVAGPVVAANFNVPAAVVAQTLGRPPSGGAANLQVNLVDPSSMYGERMNQVDLRVGKRLRYGRSSSVVSLDIYNLLNSNAVLLESNAYAIFRRPQAILIPRFAKVSLQFDF